MSRRLGLAAVVLGAVLALAGCSTDVRGEIRGTVEDITLDANARDAGAVRRGVDDLLRQLEVAVREGEMTSAEAARIAELATRVRDNADSLEQQDEPEPEPTTESPSPEPTTESPSPEPTTESPSPEPTPEPTPPPATEPPPVVEPTPPTAAEPEDPGPDAEGAAPSPSPAPAA